MAFVWARNTVTGKVVKIPEHYLGHPTLGINFVTASKGDKEYVPELYKPRSAEEFISEKPTRSRKDKDIVEPVINLEPEAPRGGKAD